MICWILNWQRQTDLTSCLCSLLLILSKKLIFLIKQRLSGPPGMTMDWQGAPASPSSYTVKRILRLDIPVDTYPNVSFQYATSILQMHNYLIMPCLTNKYAMVISFSSI